MIDFGRPEMWGSLVNTVRNLARGIWIIIEEREPNDREEKRGSTTTLFTVAMKLHLPRVCEPRVNTMSSFQYFKSRNGSSPLEIASGLGLSARSVHVNT